LAISPGRWVTHSPDRGDVMATATTPRAGRVPAPQVKDQPLFIGGKFVDGSSNKTFPAINPATGEMICQVAEAGAAAADRAVQAAGGGAGCGPAETRAAAQPGRPPGQRGGP